MAKRMKFGRVKRWAKVGGGVGGTATLLLISYLVFLGSIEITETSGDMVCSGTRTDPCLAFVNITVKEDIFIYPNESWVNTSFITEPRIKEIYLYRSWGFGWREIKLTETCNASWCGGKSENNKFSYAFREGKNYQLKFEAYKHSPYETVNWSFWGKSHSWEGIPKREFILTGNDTIKIANWNLQVFGESKASKNELMDFYVSVIDDYDIIFIQEIRDESGEAFDTLCNLLSYKYLCKNSSRAGRTAMKEQYGIFWREDIELVELQDFNPDPEKRWERPPIKAYFNIDGYEITIFNIHTTPDDVPNELNYLEDVIVGKGNTIVLGDLNADCNYYNPLSEDDFDDWHWVIKDYEDTTVKATDCAYDRIIMNDEAYEEYIQCGIYKENITKDVSDHYLVWVEINNTIE